MRRIVILIAIAIALASPLSASSVSAQARGNAVLTSDRARYAFSHNPAFLSSSGFSLNIPIQASLYNVTGILGSDFTSNMKGIMFSDPQTMATSVLDILRSFNGTMDLVSLEEGASLSVAGFGAGVFLTQKAMTHHGSVGMHFSLELEAEIDFGLGWRWRLGDDYTLALGLMNRTGFTLTTSHIGVDTLVDIVLDPSQDLDIRIYDTVFDSFDIGAYLAMPLGFSTAVVVRDIGPDDQGMAIDTAIGWSGKASLFSLEAELGLRAWNEVRDEEDLMKSLNAGLSLGITRFITLSTGIDGGYPSFGIDIHLLCFAISAAWHWQDYGVIYGLAPRDVLSLEIALLID